ncbi:hypothetical protein IM792_01410 [Mucilaginibacter sp. JRF]|uniref:hypothetical protein n=1 Tax=Mucilaginibacter sp. JRF TaxID=2780088 RepID=UPI00187F4B6B|nr:hypothetical protein [Mucilaginibacter sp. JRF]MBE9583097.1 hypothetical protein [Mucilaginibacter sp. JRF]
MKTKFTYAAILGMVIVCLSNCKKGEQINPETLTSTGNLTETASSTTNKVVTIAGMANSPGFVDGKGSIARFSRPWGLQYLKDGSLYVADRDNDAIRKISPDGTVSTQILKREGVKFLVDEPLYVGEDNRKNLHVIADTDGDAYSHSYIFNAAREVIREDSYPYTVQAHLAKDPYKDVFWYTSGYSIGQHQLEDGVSQGFSVSYLFDPSTERGRTLSGLFVGRNKVIYFAYSSGLYKRTPGGVVAPIYRGLILGQITSIVLNADSRTIYLAASGFIQKIENGKLIKLAGPNATNPDGRDGVGFGADVNAFSLALGDNENSLYFTDTKTHTVRKLMLK